MLNNKRKCVIHEIRDVIDLRSSVSLFHMFAEVYLKECRR